jgi:CARDB.
MGNKEVGPSKAETAIMDVSTEDNKADLVVSLKKEPRTKSFLLKGLRCTFSLSEPLRQSELEVLRATSTLSVVVSNIGNRTAQNSVLRVYASHDCRVDKEDLEEIGSVDVAPLQPGSSVTARVDLKRTLNATCFILLVADGNRAVEESNENNNVRRIDL